MLKSKLKQFGFVLCLILTMLMSPAASAACACTALHNHQAGGEHQSFSKDSAEHCSSHISREKDARQANQASLINKSVENKAANSNCNCCLNDASQRAAAIDKKSYQATEFYPAIPTAHFDLPDVCQIKSIHFFTANVSYSARSRISDKPARAPPVL